MFRAAQLGVILLAGAAPASAADVFVGRWAIDPAGCLIYGETAATAPLIVTEQTVKWSQTSCTIKKSYRIGDTLALQASCASEGRIRVIPIGLTLQGRDRIAVTWDKAKAGDMRRCK